MNAVISGRAGVALLQDGDVMHSLHLDAPELLVSRQPEEFPYLFGDVQDLEFLENVEVDRVRTVLTLAGCREDALDLILILLDSELPSDVRQEAAGELETLLQNSAVTEPLERILYARPLPVSADADGALDCCRLRKAETVVAFLNRLIDRQPAIEIVRRAWDAVPDELFQTDERRAHLENRVVRTGLLRRIVEVTAGQPYENPDPTDCFGQEAWVNPTAPNSDNSFSILAAWTNRVFDFVSELQSSAVEADEASSEG